MGDETKTAPQAEVRAVVAVQDGRGLVAADIDGMFRIARMVAASGLAPKGIDSAEKIVLCMAHGAALGLPPLQALQVIAPVNGRVSIFGDAALALIRSRGLVADYSQRVEGDGDARCAVVSAKRTGNGGTVEQRFSVADAKRAGLWGKTGPWSQYPDRMLMWRARSWVLRDLFGDVLMGLHIYEESDDIELPRSEYEVKDTPAKPAEAAPRKAEPEFIPFGKQKEGKS